MREEPRPWNEQGECAFLISSSTLSSWRGKWASRVSRFVHAGGIIHAVTHATHARACPRRSCARGRDSRGVKRKRERNKHGWEKGRNVSPDSFRSAKNCRTFLPTAPGGVLVKKRIARESCEEGTVNCSVCSYTKICDTVEHICTRTCTFIYAHVYTYTHAHAYVYV